VKLLLDENLSPRLVPRLADVYPGSIHVQDCGLASAEDEQVWKHAAEHGYLLVSKDIDFHDRSVLSGAPPKLIWLRTGNCSTATIERLLRRSALLIQRFLADPDKGLLILR
jgi:predicted nuclease of predicted toxin-antitoxin system